MVLQGGLPSEHCAQVTCGCGRRGSPRCAASVPAQRVPPCLAIVAPVPQWQALPPARDTVATVDTSHEDIGLLTYRSSRTYLRRFALYLSMLEEVAQPALWTSSNASWWLRPSSLLSGECPRGTPGDTTRARKFLYARDDQQMRGLEEQRKKDGTTLSIFAVFGELILRFITPAH